MTDVRPSYFTMEITKWASCHIAVAHVLQCMPKSLKPEFPLTSTAGKTFPAFPAHAQRAILRIWQEAYGKTLFMEAPAGFNGIAFYEQDGYETDTSCAHAYKPA